jgi:hypothetical protein
MPDSQPDMGPSVRSRHGKHGGEDDRKKKVRTDCPAARALCKFEVRTFFSMIFSPRRVSLCQHRGDALRVDFQSRRAPTSKQVPVIVRRIHAGEPMVSDYPFTPANRWPHGVELAKLPIHVKRVFEM